MDPGDQDEDYVPQMQQMASPFDPYGGPGMDMASGMMPLQGMPEMMNPYNMTPPPGQMMHPMGQPPQQPPPIPDPPTAPAPTPKRSKGKGRGAKGANVRAQQPQMAPGGYPGQQPPQYARMPGHPMQGFAPNFADQQQPGYMYGYSNVYGQPGGQQYHSYQRPGQQVPYGMPQNQPGWPVQQQASGQAHHYGNYRGSSGAVQYGMQGQQHSAAVGRFPTGAPQMAPGMPPPQQPQMRVIDSSSQQQPMHGGVGYGAYGAPAGQQQQRMQMPGQPSSSEYHAAQYQMMANQGQRFATPQSYGNMSSYPPDAPQQAQQSMYYTGQPSAPGQLPTVSSYQSSVQTGSNTYPSQHNMYMPMTHQQQQQGGSTPGSMYGAPQQQQSQQPRPATPVQQHLPAQVGPGQSPGGQPIPNVPSGIAASQRPSVGSPAAQHLSPLQRAQQSPATTGGRQSRTSLESPALSSQSAPDSTTPGSAAGQSAASGSVTTQGGPKPGVPQGTAFASTPQRVLNGSPGSAMSGGSGDVHPPVPMVPQQQTPPYRQQMEMQQQPGFMVSQQQHGAPSQQQQQGIFGHPTMFEHPTPPSSGSVAPGNGNMPYYMQMQQQQRMMRPPPPAGVMMSQMSPHLQPTGPRGMIQQPAQNHSQTHEPAPPPPTMPGQKGAAENTLLKAALQGGQRVNPQDAGSSQIAGRGDNNHDIPQVPLTPSGGFAVGTTVASSMAPNAGPPMTSVQTLPTAARPEQMPTPPGDPVTTKPQQYPQPPRKNQTGQQGSNISLQCVSMASETPRISVDTTSTTTTSAGGALGGPFSPISPGGGTPGSSSSFVTAPSTSAPANSRQDAAGSTTSQFSTYTSAMQLPIPSTAPGKVPNSAPSLVTSSVASPVTVPPVPVPARSVPTTVSPAGPQSQQSGSPHGPVAPLHPPDVPVSHNIPPPPQPASPSVSASRAQVFRGSGGATVQVNIQPGSQADTMIVVQYPSSVSNGPSVQQAPVMPGQPYMPPGGHPMGPYHHPPAPRPSAEMQGHYGRPAPFPIPPAIPTPMEYTHPPEPTPPVSTRPRIESQFTPMIPSTIGGQQPNPLASISNAVNQIRATDPFGYSTPSIQPVPPLQPQMVVQPPPTAGMSLPPTVAEPQPTGGSVSTPEKPKRRRGPRKKKVEPLPPAEPVLTGTAEGPPEPETKRAKAEATLDMDAVDRAVELFGEEEEKTQTPSKADASSTQDTAEDETSSVDDSLLPTATAKAKKQRTPRQPKKSGEKTRKPRASAKKRQLVRKKKRGEETDSEPENAGPSAPPVNTSDTEDNLDLDKRRSGRVLKRKRYTDDFDASLIGGSDDESPRKRGKMDVIPPVSLFFVDNPNEDESQIVEKILGSRNRTTEKEAVSTEEEEEPVVEYYVKYKNFSYLHCEWKTEEELERGDKRFTQKLKRFRMKRESMADMFDIEDEEYFNPDYTEVDRVLDMSTALVPVSDDESKPLRKKQPSSSNDAVKVEEKVESPKSATETTTKTEETTTKATTEETPVETPTEEVPVKSPENQELKQDENSQEKEETGSVDSNATIPHKTKEVTHYLVKWCSLPYEESTWELPDDIGSEKIAKFMQRRACPNLKCKPRPRPEDWRQIETVAYKNGNTLRDYQKEGLNWLRFCWFHRRNCILADEMGLGKTIQSIAFLIEMYKWGVFGPMLVVAPLSTIHNWQREFETWSELNAIVYHGTFASRRMIQEFEMYYKDAKGARIKGQFKFNVLITTYEMVLSDAETLQEIEWKACIIDEAHRLKNRNCKLLQAIQNYKIDHRVLLTGTPLQNNVNELFSLLNFLEPTQFSSSTAFLEEFGSLQSDDQVNKLQGILKPMMLRRLKEDVEKDLAPKEETIIEVELTNIQKKYYRAILERNFTFLTKGAAVPSLMNTVMELRKCCNHPFLINGAEDEIISQYECEHTDMPHDEAYHQAAINASGKLVLIDKLLPRLKDTGHKVLIFSQMVRCLDILEDYLMYRKYTCERIDGNVRGDLRQAAIDRFSRTDSDRFVFLLCTRAGGLGINLTAADTVIIFDSDWNPQNDLQAQARCHRIGQEREVKVYRLITRNSYEREMFDKASLKLGLDRAVLQSMGTKPGDRPKDQLSKKDIEELLRKGAYGAIMDESNENDNFCEEDIDLILQRRTQTITIQPGVKGSTFAKASFAMTENRSDIDINDPNFWQKWAKKADIDVDTNPDRNLIIYEPRRRKRRFDENVYQNSGMSEESDSDADSDAPRKSRRSLRGGRQRGAVEDEDYVASGSSQKEGAFGRAEYFKVEKYLSSFGWGRWKIIKEKGGFDDLSEVDIEQMARTLLLQCLRQYQGDEKIREFIWELITPPNANTSAPNNDGAGGISKDVINHLGLYGPVPRGRKVRRASSKDELAELLHQGWAARVEYNPVSLTIDSAYQKHLMRHANKVLLRVRLLYYLHREVIGDFADDVMNGAKASEIDLTIPWHPEIPVPWWDLEADKSLLVGIFKHGYENISALRTDPCLCFLARCGPPVEAGMETIEAEDTEASCQSASRQKSPATVSETPRTSQEEVDDAKSETESTMDEKPSKSDAKFDKSETSPAKKDTASTKDDSSAAPTPAPAPVPTDDETIFPTTSELNSRFRKLLTLAQRTSKMTILREEQKQKKIAKIAQLQAVMQERELRRLEERQRFQSRWSRREETDFYRTLVSYGVEHDGLTGELVWGRFRQLAKLETKYDHTLADYYHAYMAMCKRVAKLPLNSKEEETAQWLPPSLSEERANKCLQRVELLTRVRTCLQHPKFTTRIKLARRTADLPLWWECGRHDVELMTGVAKHGLSRTEENIVHDPEFSFLDIWKSFQKESQNQRTVTRSTAKLADNEEVSSAEQGDEPKPETKTEKAEESEEKPAAAGVEEAGKSNESPPEEKSDGQNPENLEKKKEESEEKSEVKESENKENDLKENDATKEPKKENTEQTTESTSTGNQKSLPESELTISQIISQQTGSSFMHWPKERMIVFRLQNLCSLVESGDWPTARTALLMAANYPPTPDDARSNTPETPAAAQTPSMVSEDGSRDIPSPMTTYRGMYDALLRGSRPPGLTPSSASTSTSRRRGKSSGSRDQASRAAAAQLSAAAAAAMANPFSPLLTDFLMGSDGTGTDERMRMFLHQSFLQQLDLQSMTSLAAAAAAAGGTGATASGSTGKGSGSRGSTSASSVLGGLPGLASAQLSALSASAAASGGDEALNLSTKPSAKSEQASKTKPKSNIPIVDPNKPLPFNDLAAMASLPADTPVPVINLKDRSRLTGKEAPTLRNLAQWLSEHPQYIIDMPAPAMVPFAPGTSGAGEIEPGEVVRSASTASSASGAAAGGATSGSRRESAEEHHSQRLPVVNRKTGARVTGHKAPTVKNLASWLEKNGDWDVDSAYADVVKKLKLPDKYKRRIHGLTPISTTTGASSTSRGTKSGSSNTAAMTGIPGMSGLTSQQQQQLLQQQLEQAALLDPTMLALMMDPMSAAGMMYPFMGNPLMGIPGYGMPLATTTSTASSSSYNPFFGGLDLSMFGASLPSATTSASSPVSTTASKGRGTPAVAGIETVIASSASDKPSKSSASKTSSEPRSSTAETKTVTTASQKPATSSVTSTSAPSLPSTGFGSSAASGNSLAAMAAADPFAAAMALGINPFMFGTAGGSIPSPVSTTGTATPTSNIFGSQSSASQAAAAAALMNPYLAATGLGGSGASAGFGSQTQAMNQLQALMGLGGFSGADASSLFSPSAMAGLMGSGPGGLGSLASFGLGGSPSSAGGKASPAGSPRVSSAASVTSGSVRKSADSARKGSITTPAGSNSSELSKKPVPSSISSPTVATGSGSPAPAAGKKLSAVLNKLAISAASSTPPATGLATATSSPPPEAEKVEKEGEK